MRSGCWLSAFCLLMMIQPLRAEEPAPGKQVPAKFGEGDEKLDYLLFLPKSYESQESWPLMVFLHGAGERGSDLELVKKWGPPRIVGENAEFPFVLISPQCPTGQRWEPESLNKLIDEIAGNYKVDKSRIYLTGLSMGGFGTFALAAAHPEKFAAIVPICGGGDPETAKALKGIPTWVFHGGKDTAVSVDRSKQMVKAIEEVGGHVQLTIYPDAGHNSWSETYANPEVYKWLLEQKKSK